MGRAEGTTVKQFLIKAGSNAALAHDSANNADPQVFGAALDVGLCDSGSFQITWAGLTGTINATYALFCSGDGINWVPKSNSAGAPLVLTLSGANGTDSFSLNAVISEEFYKAVYTPVGVTGGTVQSIGFAK